MADKSKVRPRKRSKQETAENSGFRRRGGPPQTLFQKGNDHRFPPGQSGNPGGRPKLLSDAYRSKLSEVSPNDPEQRTYAEIIAAGQVVRAISDTQAAREIRSATEGSRVNVFGTETDLGLGVVLQMDEAELDRLIRNLEVLLHAGAGDGAVEDQRSEASGDTSTGSG
ncbi:hypothetical protein TFLX_00800 [Thermoflexales bacterium]|nr:hypothetical protein TFLX_00800 [Thermoflexales bacterium]